MAEQALKTNGMMAALDGLGGLPVLKQVGLLFGVAASVAIGVGVAMWAKEPAYAPLYTDVGTLEAAQLVEMLERERIGYKVDTASGLVMVQSEKINDARMLLAKEGFPAGNAAGYELLDKEQGFGTSQFMEKTRYLRSIEGELAKTISSLTPVRNARVHLAMPKRSVFINDTRKPTASVFVELYPSRSLEKAQVQAIIHLVASSVPELSSKDVTVVDQRGNLLSDSGDTSEMAFATKQLEYTATLERQYLKRISDILEPMVGYGRFKVQVTADVDFNVVEQTSEQYNPDSAAVRSEQSMTESNNGGAVQGVPGALSNQPPVAGEAPQDTTQPGEEGQQGAKSSEANAKRSQSTRNYELDRTISHTRRQVGDVKRLSVAVVLDDKVVPPPADADSDAQPTRQALTEAEIERITQVVKDAVGFSVSRGDSVSVVNQAFQLEAMEPLPEGKLWEQAWFWDYASKGLGILVVLALVFGVLRPILKGLATTSKESVPDSFETALANVGVGGSLSAPAGDAVSPEVFLTGNSNPLLPGPDASFEQHIDAVKALVAEDPRRVAQVVKDWLANG
jgi:flagellar M-ring protein FliF